MTPEFIATVSLRRDGGWSKDPKGKIRPRRGRGNGINRGGEGCWHGLLLHYAIMCEYKQIVEEEGGLGVGKQYR